MSISDDALRALFLEPGMNAAFRLADTLAEVLSLNPASDAHSALLVEEICESIRRQYQTRRSALLDSLNVDEKGGA